MSAALGEDRSLSLESVGLVAIDLDGTLLRCDGSICVQGAEAIAEAAERGVKIVLATGRSPRSALPIYKALDLTTPLICHNGALILDPPSARTLYHRTLDGEVARAVLKIGHHVSPDIGIGVEVFDRCHTRSSLTATAAPPPGVPQLIAAALEAEVEAHEHGDASAEDACGDSATALEALMEPEVDALACFEPVLATPGGVTKVMFTGEPHLLGGIQSMLHERLGEQVSFACSHLHLLQVVHHEAHKAAAIEKIIAMYGLKPGGVMCIGDAPNDLTMIRWAGLGVATMNGWPEVKTAAHCTVHSNEEGGVAHAIRKYVLGVGS